MKSRGLGFILCFRAGDEVPAVVFDFVAAQGLWSVKDQAVRACVDTNKIARINFKVRNKTLLCMRGYGAAVFISSFSSYSVQWHYFFCRYSCGFLANEQGVWTYPSGDIGQESISWTYLPRVSGGKH